MCKTVKKGKTMTTSKAVNETSCMAFCKCLAAAVLATTASVAMAATGSTRVTPSGGGAYTDYSTLSAAVAACTGGETVKLLDNSETLSADLGISVDITLDLGGFTATFGSKELQPSSNTHLVVTNGTIKGLTSLNAGAGAVVDLHDTVVSCGVLATGNGTINVYDGCLIRATSQMSSPWVNGAVNIYGGEICPTVERAAGYEHRGVKTTVYGGAFSIVPFNNDYDRFNLAEGRVAICSNYSHKVEGLGTYNFHYHVGMNNDRDFEASLSSGVYAEKLGESFVAGVTGDVVTLLKDCTYTTRTEIRRDVVFDLGGHTLTGNGNHVVSISDSTTGISAVISNGTIEAIGNYTGILAHRFADITLGDGLTLRGGYACYYNGTNVSVVIDGASVETTTMCNFYTAGNGSFVVRGDSAVNVTKFKALNTQDDSFAVAEGGSWNLDPAGYVTNNFVKLYRSGAATYKYQVMPWEDICTEGWTFRVGDEAPVVSGTCYTPSAPIPVRYEGDAPERKTLVADFSGLVLSSPSDSLSFESAPGFEKSLALTYEDSKLYASALRGFAIFVR